MPGPKPLSHGYENCVWACGSVDKAWPNLLVSSIAMVLAPGPKYI